MRRLPQARPAVRRLAAALVPLPVLSACSSPAAEPVAAPPVAEVGLAGAPVPVAPPVVVPADAADAADGAEVVEARPGDTAVPPGDPGVDAPPAPEPTGTEVHAHEEAPERVPPSALLWAADLGPGWAGERAPTDDCAPRTRGPSASRALRSDDGSSLVETVQVAADGEQAVVAWRRALATCGHVVSPFALGEAGLAADGDGERVLVTTAEQVVVVLRATGPLAADPALDDWADLAFGTSCPAAPDGCH